MKPGTTITPPGSTPAPSAASSQVTASSRPSWTTSSPGPSRSATGSTSQARLISRSAMRRPIVPDPSIVAPSRSATGRLGGDGWAGCRSPAGAHDPGSGQQVEQGHPDGDPVRDLVGDHRPGMVSDLRGNLDPLVHRPGMHDQGV